MKKTIISLAICFSFLAVAKSASALIPLNPDLIKPKVELNPEVVKAWKEKRCEKIKNKIEERAGNFKTRKEKHLSAYNNLKDRISKFVEKAKANGYDTADLEADIKVLEGKISKFKTDYEAYVGELNGVKDYLCENTGQKSKDKMNEIRAMLKTVHQDSKDIRDYYKNTIKPDIKALKNQKKTEGTDAAE